MASMETVEPGIYRRNGKYLVPIYDPAVGKKRWSHPDVPRGGFSGLRDAKAFKRARESERAEAPPSSVLCDEYAERWPDTHPRPEESTNSVHRSALKDFVRDFEGVPMAHVSREVAKTWVKGGPVPRELEKQASGWTGASREGEVLVAKPHLGLVHKVVRAMWNDAVDDGKVSRNPFANLRLQQSRGRADAVMLSPDELDQLVACAEGEWGDFGRGMVGPMIVVAAWTGMRPGELYSMRWHWVDWEAGEVAVKKALQGRTGKETLPGKTRKAPRVLPLLPRAEAALRVLRDLRRVDDDRVFYTQNGRPFQQRTHRYYWKPVRARFHRGLALHRRGEIPADFDFYELRHRFGSELAAAGVTPYDIAEMMGHVDGGALAQRLYIHTDARDARERVRRAVLKQQRRAS